MGKETIFVELVGLEDVFDPVYCQGIRRIIQHHESHFYRFALWDPVDAVQPSVPDICLVGVQPDDRWMAVCQRINRCHSLNIGLLGAEHAMLGFPAVSKLCDLSSLVLLRKGQSEEIEPLWDRQAHFQPGGVPTMPTALDSL